MLSADRGYKDKWAPKQNNVFNIRQKNQWAGGMENRGTCLKFHVYPRGIPGSLYCKVYVH